MRILVVSDSHGRASALREAVQSQPEAELILFLGDGYEEADAIRAELPPEKTMLLVRGNNDWCCPEPMEQTAEAGGIKLLMMHGHSRQVKWGLDEAEAAARSCGAQVLLFGHTHEPMENYHDGLHILNPGSLSMPMYGEPTYGLIDVLPKGILTSIVPLYPKK